MMKLFRHKDRPKATEEQVARARDKMINQWINTQKRTP
jgi:hypothetical protein